MASSAGLPHCSSDSQIPRFDPPVRPRFNSYITADRLREGSGRPPSFSMVTNIRKDRKSIFRETGLLDDDGDSAGQAGAANHQKEQQQALEKLPAEPWRSGPHHKDSDEPQRRPSATREENNAASSLSPAEKQHPWYARLTPGRRPCTKGAAAPPAAMSSLSRFTMIALLIAVVVPGFNYKQGRSVVVDSAGAGAIRNTKAPVLDTRASSPTAVCKRWSQQSRSLQCSMLPPPHRAIPSQPFRRFAWLTGKGSGVAQWHAVRVRRPGKDDERPDGQHVEYVQAAPHCGLRLTRGG